MSYGSDNVAVSMLGSHSETLIETRSAQGKDWAQSRDMDSMKTWEIRRESFL